MAPQRRVGRSQGGHGQFAAVPLNLGSRGKASTADYFVGGTWARRRPEVLRLYGQSFVYEDLATIEVLFMSPEVLFMSLEFYLHCRWQSSLPLVYIIKVG